MPFYPITGLQQLGYLGPIGKLEEFLDGPWFVCHIELGPGVLVRTVLDKLSHVFNIGFSYHFWKCHDHGNLTGHCNLQVIGGYDKLDQLYNIGQLLVRKGV